MSPEQARGHPVDKRAGHPGISFGAPVRFPAAVTGDRVPGASRLFDVLPDGRFVGVTTTDAEHRRSTPMQIRVVTNWLEEARSKMPARERTCARSVRLGYNPRHTMPLTAGVCFGHDEILPPVGAGGPTSARPWERTASYRGSSVAMERTWL